MTKKREYVNGESEGPKFFCGACEGFFPESNYITEVKVEGDSYRYVTICSDCGQISHIEKPIPLSVKTMDEDTARQNYQELMVFNDEQISGTDDLIANGWTIWSGKKPMTYQRLLEIYHRDGEWHSLCIIHYGTKEVYGA